MQRSARIASTAVGVIVLLAVTVVGAPTVAADQTSINVPVVHIEGRGHGHGVGMSQWGAYTLAGQGASTADIIGTFYPGTQLGTAGGEVVVPLERSDRVQVQFPTGGEIRSARGGDQQPGFPVQVAPGSTVELWRDAAGYHVGGGSVAPLHATATTYSTRQQDCILIFCPPDDGDDESPTTTAPPPPDAGGGDGGDGGDRPPADDGGSDSTTSTTTPSEPVSSTPVWAVPADSGTLTAVGRGRSYRGLFEFTGAPGAARLRNHVDVEHYLKGMGEVPGTWPAAAVQAQAIAARTFALRAMAASGEICDSESCQVYAGTAHESAGQIAAVDATAGTVVLYGGALAATFYSASGGGISATTAEGFGTPGDLPYLPAKSYPTVHPDPYSLDIALTDVAARLGYGGTITDIRVDEAGPSGRAVRMTIVGDAGEMGVDPQDFRRNLGLRSTLFTVATSEAEAPPPPPEVTDDPDVVGTTVASVDLDTVRSVSPAQIDRRLVEQALAPAPATSGPMPVPLPLAAVAALAIVATTAAAAHVRSRRHLRPAVGMRIVLSPLVRMRSWKDPRR